MGYNSIGGGGGGIANPQDIHEEYADFASLPTTGEAGVIYITINNNLLYRWTGSVYVEVSPTGAVDLSSNSVTELSDVSNAGSGQIITGAERTKLGNLNEYPNDIVETSFTLVDNTTTPTDIMGLLFNDTTVRAFHLFVTVERGTSYQSFDIQGVATDTTWEQFIEKIGDDTGVTFTITSAGQMQYQTTNLTQNADIKYRAIALGVV